LAYGQNFGRSSQSPEFVVGGTGSEFTSWIADTALSVKPSAGVTSNAIVAVSAASLSSIHSSLVSYDAASISALLIAGTVPLSGAFSVTVSASAIGNFGNSQRVKILSGASSSSWISDSSIVAKVIASSGAISPVLVSVRF